MANNITTNATFATANMKPVPDEQIDALWGQNSGDNQGYLFYKEEPIPVVSSSINSNTFFFFTKKPGKSGLKFTWYGGGAAGPNDWYVRVMSEGNATALTATKLSVSNVAGSYVRFDVDISSLTNYGSYVARVFHTGDNGYAAGWLTHGSGAGY